MISHSKNEKCSLLSSSSSSSLHVRAVEELLVQNGGSKTIDEGAGSQNMLSLRLASIKTLPVGHEKN